MTHRIIFPRRPGLPPLMVVLIALAAALVAARPLPSLAAADATIVTDLALSAEDDGFTGRFAVQGDAKARLILMRHPDRIAVDFPETLSAAGDAAMPENPLVDKLQQGLVPPDRYRFIFYLKHPVTADLKPVEDDPSALSLTLTPATEAEFQEAFARQTIRPVTLEADDGVADEGRRFTVVVDPGHGGIDTGAIGKKDGTQEKDINLAFALVLRDALEKTGEIDAVLTRETDKFIPLSERAEFGRRAGADLFISVHADSIRYADLRGATVYTLSAKASDALARQIAASENAADRFAGPEWQQEQPEVFDILLDLTRRETEAFSERFADDLVDTLRTHDVRLINNPKRSAGFRVLKAPDVPSVLVELGYLSNDQDEKLLASDEWQEGTAAAIADAALTFLEHRSALADLQKN
ncbi:N-acetylmuramoyl-L-alanine amidase family protein [Consotaella aegiceratis]|uniref:N-acetylmuramoyl-L-alanine amidase family protein n=1 Tax=Consotaella aegiceratis TaxID=3097961 RepID=UPI002F400169